MNSDQLVGVGLRHPHYKQVMREQPPIGWFEVHSENFFHNGGPSMNALCEIRKNYPISLHGVGLSLGSEGSVLNEHLVRLKNLFKLVDPFLISEHLSWGYVGGVYMHDLLPVPYHEESLQLFSQNINRTQDFLDREILIENPSSYIEYGASNLEEADFLVTLCKNTGAKILLDINNIFVSCSNHGWDAKKYIDAIPTDLVKEIHLAGHSVKTIAPGEVLRIDTHDNAVCSEVWNLYDYAIKKFGPIHTLLEWDAQIPEFSVLMAEASKARTYLRGETYAGT